MNNHVLFTNLMSEWGDCIGLPQLKPNQDQVCTLAFDQDTTVHIGLREQPGEVLFSTTVGSVGTASRATVFGLLLSEHLKPRPFYVAFAWDEATQAILLTAKSAIQQLNVSVMSSLMETFLALSAHSRSLLVEKTKSRQTEHPAGSPIALPASPLSLTTMFV